MRTQRGGVLLYYVTSFLKAENERRLGNGDHLGMIRHLAGFQLHTAPAARVLMTLRDQIIGHCLRTIQRVGDFVGCILHAFEIILRGDRLLP